MSERASPASARVRGYLQSQLRRNPQAESGTIVDQRAQALGLYKKFQNSPREVEDQSALRQANLKELERIRSVAFQAPIADLLGALDRLNLEAFPDLALLARRLRTIVECRQSFPPLTSHRHFSGDFFACLKQVLTSPTRDVAVLREQVIASFQKRTNRRQGKAMIRLLKAKLPELYALEAQWLETLLRFQPRASGATSGNGSNTETPLFDLLSNRWVLWICLFVAVKFAISLAFSSAEKPKSRGSSPAVVAPRVSPSFQSDQPGWEGPSRGPEGVRPSPQERGEEARRRHQQFIEDSRRRSAEFDADMRRRLNQSSSRSDEDAPFATPRVGPAPHVAPPSPGLRP